MKHLTTSDIARAVGVHPNTVRLYESLGLLPPIPRSPSGYRLFTEFHFDQMRLARLVTRCTWLGGEIRRAALDVAFLSGSGRFGEAVEKAHHLLALVRMERAHAEKAAEFLEQWATRKNCADSARCLRIGEAARLLHVTHDMLRSWERNGLIRVRRNPTNGYREYSDADIDRLRVIRVLRHARYSTMSILRMMSSLDRGQKDGLRQVLDTPSPEEDACYATDRWLSTLTEVEASAVDLVVQAQSMLDKHARNTPGFHG